MAVMSTMKLGEASPEVTLERIDDDVHRVRLLFQLREAVNQDDWRIQIEPAFEARISLGTPPDANGRAHHRSAQLSFSRSHRLIRQ
jgi:hypothetical protein